MRFGVVWQSKVNSQKMSKINIEIREIENGWVVEESYFGDETFLKRFVDAEKKVNKILQNFKKEIQNN
ncbi:hypothetical protein LCGC14_1377250 [marine sediment metagenome]|uniref:Uncharacterized protein n=1 Tax=marine sediment metagenome TaxID=412755 RepID=A0A0F9MJ05_9ZZZZ